MVKARKKETKPEEVRINGKKPDVLGKKLRLRKEMSVKEMRALLKKKAAEVSDG